MKRKNSIWLYLLLILGIGLFLLFGCQNEDNVNICDPSVGFTTAIFNPNINYNTVTDQNGNVYKTVIIGSQTWMAENLRATCFRNGDPLPEITDSITWGNLSTAAYCNYNNTRNTDTIATYGRLYNWFAVNDDRNIAPDGWHVATHEEWMTMVNHLQGDSIAGGLLKEMGINHWDNPNKGATNESGFTALPGGQQRSYWGFSEMGEYGYWWSASEGSEVDENAWHIHLCTRYILVGGCECGKVNGYAVRCVKD